MSEKDPPPLPTPRCPSRIEGQSGYVGKSPTNRMESLIRLLYDELENLQAKFNCAIDENAELKQKIAIETFISSGGFARDLAKVEKNVHTSDGALSAAAVSPEVMKVLDKPVTRQPRTLMLDRRMPSESNGDTVPIISSVPMSSHEGRGSCSSAASRVSVASRHSRIPAISSDIMPKISWGKFRNTTRQTTKRSIEPAMLLDTLTAVVILVNAICIGIQADWFQESVAWDIVEITFILYYTCECVVKLAYYRCDYFFGSDRFWNSFDFFCLILSYIDLALTHFLFNLMNGSAGMAGMAPFMKLFRLLRLMRLVRVFHFSIFDELKQMVLGLVSGMRVMFWAIILLFLYMFVFGMIVRSVYGEEYVEFSSVPLSMFTAFRCYVDGCTSNDGRPLQAQLYEQHGFLVLLGYIFSTMFVIIGIFNLIMAIFIDNVMTRSLKRKLMEIGSSTPSIKKEAEEVLLYLHGETIVHHPELLGHEKPFVEADRDFSVTREVFNEWLLHPEMHALLEAADVETALKSELFDVLDVDMGGEVGFDEFVSGLMRLRGPITKSDIVAVRLKVRYMTGMIEDMWNIVVGSNARERSGRSVDTPDAVDD